MLFRFGACAIAFLLVACSGGAGFGSADRSSSDDDDEDPEESPVAIPSEVSGSFLMDCDWINEYDESQETQTIGCAAYDDNKERYSGNHEFALALYHDGTQVPMETTPSKSPDWHIYGDFPTKYYHQSGSELRLKVKTDSGEPSAAQNQNIVTRTMTCSNIGKAIGDDIDYSAATDDLELLRFTSQTSWVKPDEYAGVLLGSFFCDSTGPLGALSQTAIIGAGVVEILDGTQVEPIKQDPLNFDQDGKYCFEQLTLNSKIAYVHAVATAEDTDNGCYAIKVDGAYRFIGVLMNEKEVARALSVEALEKFIREHTSTDCQS